jgi:hypothetical protein
MKIIEKLEVTRFTVEKDQWDALVQRYGEEYAARFLMTEGEFIDVEEDDFGVYAYITFNKETTPSIMSMS